MLDLALPLFLLDDLLLAQLLRLLTLLTLLLKLLARLFLAFLLSPAASHRLIAVTLSLNLPVDIVLEFKFDSMRQLDIEESRLVDV